MRWQKFCLQQNELTGLIWAAAADAAFEEHKRHGTEIPEEKI